MKNIFAGLAGLCGLIAGLFSTLVDQTVSLSQSAPKAAGNMAMVGAMDHHGQIYFGVAAAVLGLVSVFIKPPKS